MTPLQHYGPVDIDWASCLKALGDIPQSAWLFRCDPESNTTSAIRENDAAFPKRELEEILISAMRAYLPDGYQNRVVLSCVPAGCRILPHRDDFGAAQAKSLHCHIPLITHPDAIMGFPEHNLREHMITGHLYSMDASEVHYVDNDSQTDRIHLLFAHFPH
jgi:hypothetical protein